MKTKLIYILAAVGLTFASADAVTTKPRTKIQMVYQEQANGDYRLFLFGSDRALVCEEKDITIVQQGDAVNPLILECSHGGAK